MCTGFGCAQVRWTPYVPPPEYWQYVRAACDKHGALLILDEVRTNDRHHTITTAQLECLECPSIIEHVVSARLIVAHSSLMSAPNSRLTLGRFLLRAQITNYHAACVGHSLP